MFERATLEGGSVVQDCGFCGRTHFGNGRDMDRGEHDELQAKATAFPDRYMEHDYDSIAWGMLAGTTYVHGCPCNKARRYEDFIWENREMIATYLDLRAKQIGWSAARDRLIADRAIASAKEGGV